MRIEIGKSIARLRRERNITQEQLAGAVGVSAPAVSKWETGQSYPDIALLPPLARFFGVSVDTLLAYAPTLTDEAREALAGDVGALFDAEGWDAGLSRCEALLREYPNDGRLRVSLASRLTHGAVYAKEPEQMAAYRARHEAWLIQALSSEDGEARPYARYLLACLYVSQQRLDDAEAMLASLGDVSLNPQHLLPTLRRLQGRTDEAEKISQQNLLAAVGDAVNALVGLSGLAVKVGDPARAKAYADAAEAALLPLGLDRRHGFSIANARMLAAHAQGDPDALLFAAEQVTQSVLDPGSLDGNTFFNRLENAEALSPAHKKALRQMLAADFERSDFFAQVKNDPRFSALLAVLRGEKA